MITARTAKASVVAHAYRCKANAMYRALQRRPYLPMLPATALLESLIERIMLPVSCNVVPRWLTVDCSWIIDISEPVDSGGSGCGLSAAKSWRAPKRAREFGGKGCGLSAARLIRDAGLTAIVAGFAIDAVSACTFAEHTSVVAANSADARTRR
jgi:hypothetical protein